MKITQRIHGNDDKWTPSSRAGEEREGNMTWRVMRTYRLVNIGSSKVGMYLALRNDIIAR